MDRISKQVIVMRKSFVIDGKKITPRKGKYISQGCHSSVGAILGQMEKHGNFKYISSQGTDGTITYELRLEAGSAIHEWIIGSFTKIVCCVETEEELLAVYNKAKEKGLITSLIEDKGNTEFAGVPTITCCAIGPAWSDELEDITGKLELF